MIAHTQRELSLSGGRLTANVVRVGDTVRRPMTPTSAFVAALLTHLEATGFERAPRHLGRDDAGRESFSYIPGVVLETWQHYPDDAIQQAGRWLRAFHDATRGSTLVGNSSVVCHNDPGPNNAVFNDGRLAALIDFDMATPGEPLEDLGYMAWSWCVSSHPSRLPVAAQAAQVRLLLDSYGVESEQRAAIVPAMMERQSRNVRFWQAKGSEPPQDSLRPITPERIEQIVEWSERERRFIETHSAVFLAALL